MRLKDEIDQTITINNRYTRFRLLRRNLIWTTTVTPVQWPRLYGRRRWLRCRLPAQLHVGLDWSFKWRYWTIYHHLLPATHPLPIHHHPLYTETPNQSPISCSTIIHYRYHHPVVIQHLHMIFQGSADTPRPLRTIDRSDGQLVMGDPE